MRTPFRLFIAVQFLTITLALLPVAYAETPDEPVLHANTQLVVVDVIVEDKDGHPVHGFRREDFTLTESKQPQIVSYFEKHSAQEHAASGPELPPMPPGTFTDYTPVPPDGALNILLLDTLNTPMADQSYVCTELQQYVKKTKPGTRIAIFGLSQRLFLLQGFSSDPQILKDAIEHKLTPRASSLLDDAVGSGTTPDAPSDLAASAMAGIDDGGGAAGIIVSSMQQFEARQNTFQTQLRVQYTLDAFNALAHYLSAFPGRKNLIWFSGSFPINILPDPGLNNPFAVMEDNNPEFRETISLFSRAQVAVYPVDARALRADPTFSAAVSKSDPFGKRSAAFYTAQDSEHMTMSQLAEDTGGKVFYNTNDLASAVKRAIESGSNYYTLSYSPTNKNENGMYREIRVALNGNLAAAGYSLTYRHGYYTDDRRHSQQGPTTAASVSSTNSGAIYAHAAMAHGGPTPQDVLFKARILPIGTRTEETLALNNEAGPTHPMKPPFRRFAVDLAAVGCDFQFTLNKDDGRRTGTIEFSVLLYDNDGNLLNATGKTIQLNLTPEKYERFAAGVNAHFEISVPVKGGNDFLRIGVHDVSSNRFGVVEVPIAAVAHLTPLSATPAATPAQAVPAQTQPAKPSPAQKQ
jgi:VWFA-related protein